MKAIEKAATGKVGPLTINFDDFFDALGMERYSSYTYAELNKFYRKAALKNHPDKGGDVEAVSCIYIPQSHRPFHVLCALCSFVIVCLIDCFTWYAIAKGLCVCVL